MLTPWLRILPLWVLLSVAACAQNASPLVRLETRVTDRAGALADRERDALERLLATFEDSTTNQFVVLTIPTLNGQDLDSFSLAVAIANGIGTAERDNGLLVVLVTEDRKVRVEVGKGLEAAIPDALAKEVIDMEMLPYFRSGRYYDGLRGALRRLMEAAPKSFAASEH